MRLLDLYCGEGGAGAGYQRAGFEVVGVDIQPMPRYPFSFVQADAIEYLVDHWQEFDVIHASPPCQSHTWGTRKDRKVRFADGERLLAVTRERLIATGKPYIIENVVGAPMSNYWITLCGEMFGLRVIRHRLFESNILILQPQHPRHRGKVKDGYYVTACGHGGDGSNAFPVWCEAIGIDWMTKYGISQAIPPAYTEFIGRQMIEAARQAAA